MRCAALLQRWAARFAGGCRTGHKLAAAMAYRAAAFLQWIYQYVWPLVDPLVLLVAHAYVALDGELASVFKAAS